VRAKSTGRFGTPAESITAAKRRHLVAAAECYVAEHRLKGEWRIDFIGVTFDDDRSQVEHIPYAITLD
jgi:Holliday junction resolvase-like predicted endonuclease